MSIVTGWLNFRAAFFPVHMTTRDRENRLPADELAGRVQP
jgi:hypothetical protein